MAHVLIGEPVSTPDQVRGKLSPEHALEAGGVDGGNFRLGWLQHQIIFGPEKGAPCRAKVSSSSCWPVAQKQFRAYHRPRPWKSRLSFNCCTAAFHPHIR